MAPKTPILRQHLHPEGVNEGWSNVEYGLTDPHTGKISCVAFSRRDAEAMSDPGEPIYVRRCSDWEAIESGQERES